VAGRAAGSLRKRGACGAFSWGAGAERARRRAMSTDNVVGLILAAGLAVFLVVALLNPERF